MMMEGGPKPHRMEDDIVTVVRLAPDEFKKGPRSIRAHDQEPGGLVVRWNFVGVENGVVDGVRYVEIFDPVLPSGRHDMHRHEAIVLQNYRRRYPRRRLRTVCDQHIPVAKTPTT